MKSSTHVNYSDTEARILSLLRKAKGKRLNTSELADKIYADPAIRPKFPRNSILVVGKSLMLKTTTNKENFKIKKSDRRGPVPVEFWIEEGKK